MLAFETFLFWKYTFNAFLPGIAVIYAVTFICTAKVVGGFLLLLRL